MKVYINRQPKTGPWGGGTKTINKFVQTLLSSGHTVVYTLQDNDIDIIFCFDPRPNNFGEWYQDFLNYKARNPRTKIVQRVGDLGTHSKPDLTSLVKQTIDLSDYVIFPSLWAKEWIQFNKDNLSVIDNAPMKVFYENRKFNTDLNEKIKIVTHHWSTNPKKGFDIYKKFDNWCNQAGKYTFDYIGRLPDSLSLTNFKTPISAEQLSVELPKYDIYLTASEEEAGANHVLEALAAGLPIVYRESGGSIVNYCNHYGEGYSEFDEMINKVDKVIKNYSKLKQRVLQYTKTNDFVAEEYCRIITQLYEN